LPPGETVPPAPAPGDDGGSDLETQPAAPPAAPAPPSQPYQQQRMPAPVKAPRRK
jgi:hypothetical protein